jgi:hypothetical protein
MKRACVVGCYFACHTVHISLKRCYAGTDSVLPTVEVSAEEHSPETSNAYTLEAGSYGCPLL